MWLPINIAYICFAVYVYLINFMNIHVYVIVLYISYPCHSDILITHSSIITNLTLYIYQPGQHIWYGFSDNQWVNRSLYITVDWRNNEGFQWQNGTVWAWDWLAKCEGAGANWRGGITWRRNGDWQIVGERWGWQIKGVAKSGGSTVVTNSAVQAYQMLKSTIFPLYRGHGILKRSRCPWGRIQYWPPIVWSSENTMK